MDGSARTRTETRPEAARDARPARGAHVRVEGLTHACRRGAAPVLRDVDLELRPGSVAALVGRSGCGKSTLLHLIAGLSMPTRGAVHIGGRRVAGPSPSWVMTFQSPWALGGRRVARDPFLSAFADVGPGPTLARFATMVERG